MLLVAGGAIARTHHAAGERAAGAVVVAHLDRTLQAAARAGIRRPVELCRHPLAVIAGRVTEVAAVVEFRRTHDLAGTKQAGRSEPVLDLLEGAHQARA